MEKFIWTFGKFINFWLYFDAYSPSICFSEMDACFLFAPFSERIRCRNLIDHRKESLYNSKNEKEGSYELRRRIAEKTLWMEGKDRGGLPRTDPRSWRSLPGLYAGGGCALFGNSKKPGAKFCADASVQFSRSHHRWHGSAGAGRYRPRSRNAGHGGKVCAV